MDPQRAAGLVLDCDWLGGLVRRGAGPSHIGRVGSHLLPRLHAAHLLQRRCAGMYQIMHTRVTAVLSHMCKYLRTPQSLVFLSHFLLMLVCVSISRVAGA
jgi:hypothetical protein